MAKASKAITLTLRKCRQSDCYLERMREPGKTDRDIDDMTG